MSKAKLWEIAERVSSNAINGNWGDALTLIKRLHDNDTNYDPFKGM